MAWDRGFNFRATSGYVTDGANETYVLGADTYPTTRNSVTFGWSATPTAPIDRVSGNDRRIAGTHYNGSMLTFRVDLPSAGDYLVSLALGDSGAQNAQTVVLKDNTTVLLTNGSHAISANKYWDAANVEYSNAAWPGSQTSVLFTFATTTLIVTATTGGGWVINHVFVSQAGGSATPWVYRSHTKTLGVGSVRGTN